MTGQVNTRVRHAPDHDNDLWEFKIIYHTEDIFHLHFVFEIKDTTYRLTKIIALVFL